jgi:predicted aconitase with swiveling domain
MRAEIIVPGSSSEPVCAAALNILEPISFWGGISPRDGRLTDPRSSLHGRSTVGRIILIRQLRGSSSASSVLLELIQRQRAPAAIILDRPDAILALGALVAREMEWPNPPILRLDALDQSRVEDGARLTIRVDGQLMMDTA